MAVAFFVLPLCLTVADASGASGRRSTSAWQAAPGSRWELETVHFSLASSPELQAEKPFGAPDDARFVRRRLSPRRPCGPASCLADFKLYVVMKWFMLFGKRFGVFGELLGAPPCDCGGLRCPLEVEGRAREFIRVVRHLRVAPP